LKANKGGFAVAATLEETSIGAVTALNRQQQVLLHQQFGCSSSLDVSSSRCFNHSLGLFSEAEGTRVAGAVTKGLATAPPVGARTDQELALVSVLK